MGEIKSGRGSVLGLAGSQHHLQASNEDREESAQSRGSVRGRGRGRARLLPTRDPHKGPLAQRGEAFRGGLRLWGPGSQLQLVSPSPSAPQQWPQPGPADPEGREKGWCSPSSVKPQTSKGWGGTFLAFYTKPAAQGPALGRGEPSSKLRPFSAWLSGLSGS